MEKRDGPFREKAVDGGSNNWCRIDEGATDRKAKNHVVGNEPNGVVEAVSEDPTKVLNL